MSESPIHHEHDDFGGLLRDSTALGRRRALGLLGGAAALGVLAACSSESTKVESLGTPATPAGSSAPTAGSGSSANPTPTATPSTAPAAATTPTTNGVPGSPIPDETQGPFPADGSNGPNVLADGAVLRRDLTTSFGNYSGVATGIPARVELSLVDATTGAALPGMAVYAWHCTADGRYSIYEVDDQNFLRGMQESDTNGKVVFDTVFPGCYRMRWPHVHFEIFDSLSAASEGANARKVSQLALPDSECRVVYATDAYGDSLSYLDNQSLTRDNVFADGWTDQLATVSGSNENGWTISLLVRV